jgi:hypothetical protein
MLRIALLTSALLLSAGLAQAQTNHFMNESGPGGLPPAMYSTPYAPLDNFQRMQQPNVTPTPYFDGHSAIAPRDEAYSTGPSLPPLDDDAYGLPPRGMGPPEPPPAYQER